MREFQYFTADRARGGGVGPPVANLAHWRVAGDGAAVDSTSTSPADARVIAVCTHYHG